MLKCCINDLAISEQMRTVGVCGTVVQPHSIYLVRKECPHPLVRYKLRPVRPNDDDIFYPCFSYLPDSFVAADDSPVPVDVNGASRPVLLEGLRNGFASVCCAEIRVCYPLNGQLFFRRIPPKGKQQ
jgi:hypothetical protein